MCVDSFDVKDGFLFFKQKTAYELRISDWSSDVCSSDLLLRRSEGFARQQRFIDSEVPRAQDAGIGRDAVARLQQQYIARHKACDVDRFPPAAPKHGGVGRYKVANGGQRPVCLSLDRTNVV